MRKAMIGLAVSAGLVLNACSPLYNMIPWHHQDDVQIQHKEQPAAMAGSIICATGFIKSGDYCRALYCLDEITNAEWTYHYTTIDEIASVAEQIIDNNEFACSYKPDLLAMADAIYEKQRLKVASDLLLEELKDMDAIDNFKRHLWMAYNLSLSKTDSVEKTHEELQAFYGGEIFEEVMDMWPGAKLLTSYDSEISEIFDRIEKSPPEPSLRGKIEARYANCEHTH